MSKKIRMYFLCIHNRCRSQIAEAYAQHYGGEHIIAESAGLEPGDIHPFTIEVMKEVGIDISQREAKGLNMKTFTHSNLIVKLCEQVKEKCPIVPFGIQSVQWDIPDPVPSDIEAFRNTRDEIENKVVKLLQELNIPVEQAR
ncbi:arsenate reductase ArsC [Paenibacillus sp. YYML68]|uniref:arsenate reductase ArsC n=1 Tax=Paenibacillus sp. YYML68 TaxID=2909250 RepID=UPI0024913AB5|nr:arsenate reductase ArsC [Paenibacillus sp. YYML68]